MTWNLLQTQLRILSKKSIFETIKKWFTTYKVIHDLQRCNKEEIYKRIQTLKNLFTIFMIYKGMIRRKSVNCSEYDANVTDMI